MAENAEGVVSIAEMRDELQLGDDQSHDERVGRVIVQSIAWISKRLSIPLIDVDITHYLVVPRLKDYPIQHKLNDIKSIETFKYWKSVDKLRTKPTGVIAIDTLGRVTNNRIWPPEDGWPTVLFDSMFQVTVKHGLESIDPEAAVILGARQLFIGYPEIRPTASINLLLAPSFMDRVRF